MSDQSAFLLETNRVEQILAHINNQLRLIGPRYKGDDFTEQMLDLQRIKREERLLVSRKEPYFGRLDFSELPANQTKALYIGKAGLSNEKTKEILVVDWRAPVASLFYSFSGGEETVYYESPDGIVEGEVHLKRNLLIRDSQLERVVDSYVRGQEDETVTDEFLLYRLGENKDNKLRDIVSTIQQEQDKIIRTEKNKVVFIQGVAGSGKTTVALHRLAFLLYQYSGKLQAKRMIIFAPNQMFLDYISGVLPELGVGDIAQTTYDQWAIDILEKSVRVEDSASLYSYWFESPRTKEEMLHSASRLKGSITYKQLIEKKINEFENNFLPNLSLEPYEGIRLSAEQIKEWFVSDMSGDALLRKRERLIQRLKHWFEAEWKQKGIASAKEKAKAMAKLRAFSKKIPELNPLKVYTELVDDKELADIFPQEERNAIKTMLKQGKVTAADLPALVYIQIRLSGTKQTSYDHIVIDEAQDYSPFQLDTLRMMQRLPSMTVLGDLQQAIHGYSGIQGWHELQSLYTATEHSYFELDRSYRSTMEIIEFANQLLAGMGDHVRPAVPVFRSGEPVDLLPFDDERSRRKHLITTLRVWQEEGIYKTIAILGRTAEACAEIAGTLTAAGIEASLIQSKQEVYSGGLTVVPIYLAKGLEFDAVMIDQADQLSYRTDDAKLLYVGCTRALHKLQLLYNGKCTALLAR